MSKFCIHLFWKLVEVTQLTRNLRSAADLFDVKSGKISKYLVVASKLLLIKSPGFPASYYLVLASDEPVLIQCNFMVFL